MVTVKRTREGRSMAWALKDRKALSKKRSKIQGQGRHMVYSGAVRKMMSTEVRCPPAPLRPMLVLCWMDMKLLRHSAGQI